MRLSELLKREILTSSVGGIVSRFKGKSRRNTFFFEDIFAEYVDACDKAGRGDLLEKIGEEWMSRVVEQRISKPMRKLPKIAFMNLVMRPIWISTGLMDDFRATGERNRINIKTKNEGVTRITGKNRLVVGLYGGILSVLWGLHINPLEVHQSKESCEYIFEISSTPFYIESKKPEHYDELNDIPETKGTTIKDMLNLGIFNLSANNRIYFRGRPIGPIDNTVFHLFGQNKLLFDHLPSISFNYFMQIIEKESSKEKKLSLLKMLLQSMCWGMITIVAEEDWISMEINNPPYGLQPQKDNWDFLTNVILGYIWLIDKKYKLRSVREGYKRLVVNYSIN